MEEIKGIRRKIDECDQRIISAFEERMKAVRDILNYKRKSGLAIYDIGREAEVVERAIKNTDNPLYHEEVRELIESIIKISRKMQSRLLFPYNLVLIGFMGTGKTTVGNQLASMLDMNLLDMDSIIEERLGLSISEYFQLKGEPAFRQLEKELVKEVSSHSNTIISCGGGVVLQDENIDNLRTNGKLILLWASEETIYHRLKDDETRPLLKINNPLNSIKELLEKRDSLYKSAADLVINTDDKTPEEVCSEIIGRLLNSRSGDETSGTNV
ncbi:shikimate kinase [Alkaliphilus transvaalensis]|uniref:shikimate kinase n=1 Tax=Alkaliphilus transvaalensis TaxID=114628 RepID=UPI0006876EEC|nr:shikimate kinase [Alkaliphilus transvaalensis]